MNYETVSVFRVDFIGIYNNVYLTYNNYYILIIVLTKRAGVRLNPFLWFSREFGMRAVFIESCTPTFGTYDHVRSNTISGMFKARDHVCSFNFKIFHNL